MVCRKSEQMIQKSLWSLTLCNYEICLIKFSASKVQTSKSRLGLGLSSASLDQADQVDGLIVVMEC